MIAIDLLWKSSDPADWKDASARYWDFVQPGNVLLEQRLERLNTEDLRKLDAAGWYNFLRFEYFKWKFTNAFLYSSNVGRLDIFVKEGGMDALDKIRRRLISLKPSDVLGGINLVSEIPGLATAGATGLLSLLYPENFGTVDQFVVKALRRVSGLPESYRLVDMNPESLNADDGVILVRIMKDKAAELNSLFHTSEWNPRKLDMILWTYGRESQPVIVPKAPRKTSGQSHRGASDRNSSGGSDLTNHEMMRLALVPFRGQELTTSDITRIVLSAFKDFSTGSLLPNDHGEGNKSCCACAGTESRIFDKIRHNRYLVR